jgi:TolB-like protein/Tfp pilus assembly protein PilF
LQREAAVNTHNFFVELKRRNVYKVAVAYAVVGWLFIQVATQVFPFFEISNSRIRLLVLLIALGFPIALIITWAFELTPQGLKRAEFVEDLPETPSRSRVWIYVIIVAAALSLGLFFVGRYTALREAGTLGLAEKSIAVLPFENLSRDPDNAYFADGVQDEILTNLVRIADLKVIARTSAMQYKSGLARDLRKIGHELGVANVLEGSVQRSGNRVRVNAQLVDAGTHRELWGQTYDRDLADVFAIQSEIAMTIASQLRAKLTGREEQVLAVKPTNNPEAYDAYLRGVASEARSYSSSLPSASSEAAGFYERAVQVDPKFALAWARLSRVDANLYFGGLETTPGARRDGAKRALENAQKLAPNLPETLLALGYYQYWVLRDYGLAKTTFERVRKSLPGSSEIPRALAYVTRRQGHWDESIAYFEQALALDPRNVELVMDAAWTYTMLRQFPAVLKLYDRALDITPNDPDVMAAKASTYQAQGNLQEAARLLSGVSAQTPSGDTVSIKFDQLRLERNYGEAVRLLQARLDQFRYDSEPDKASDQLALALAQRLAAIPLAQRLPPKWRAIHSSSSTEIYQTALAVPAVRQGCL